MSGTGFNRNWQPSAWKRREKGETLLSNLAPGKEAREGKLNLKITTERARDLTRDSTNTHIAQEDSKDTRSGSQADDQRRQEEK